MTGDRRPTYLASFMEILIVTHPADVLDKWASILKQFTPFIMPNASAFDMSFISADQKHHCSCFRWTTTSCELNKQEVCTLPMDIAEAVIHKASIFKDASLTLPILMHDKVVGVASIEYVDEMDPLHITWAQAYVRVIWTYLDMHVHMFPTD